MRNKTITGIGECMIELSHASDGMMRQSFAGDVMNALWYARAAIGEGWDVAFYSGVGTDPMSEELVRFVKAAGIGCKDLLRIADRRPGLYMIHLDNGERSFSYWRDTSAARLLASDRDRLQRVIDQTDVVYVSGITLAILPEDDVEFLIAALGRARDAGKMVVFDPNIRPKLWDGAPRMRNTITRAAQASSIVLPSFDDEAAAFGDATPEATLARYQKLEIPTIVVKNGPGDILVQSDGQVQTIPTSALDKVVDTTGAGDSFNGGFVSALVQEGDVVAAVKAGQAISARVICHHGALLDLAEI